MSGPRFSSQAGLASLRHGRQVILTPDAVQGMVPRDGEAAFRAGDRIVPARQARELLAAVEGLPPAHDCPGLARCGNHPRWRVAVRRGTPSGARSTLYPLRLTTYHVFRPHATIAEAVLLDHAEAMDLATERADAESAEGAGR